MFASILRIVHFLVSGATLYVVIMNNQKKDFDLPVGKPLSGGEQLTSSKGESRHFAGTEDAMGSDLRMRHGVDLFRPKSSHLTAKKGLNMKS